jgi:hypothetical protein
VVSRGTLRGVALVAHRPTTTPGSRVLRRPVTAGSRSAWTRTWRKASRRTPTGPVCRCRNWSGASCGTTSPTVRRTR